VEKLFEEESYFRRAGGGDAKAQFIFVFATRWKSAFPGYWILHDRIATT
jgi:hypothetical protein